MKGPLCKQMTSQSEMPSLICSHDTCWSILYHSHREWILDWLHGDDNIKWKENFGSVKVRSELNYVL